MFKLDKTISFSILFMILSSCSVNHVIKPTSINKKEIPKFHANNTVAIINAQVSTEVVEIGKVGWAKIYGNLRQWTNATIDLLKTELTSRCFVVSNNSKKVLKLSITQASLKAVPFPGAGANCKVYLSVETSNKDTKKFEGERYSLAPPNHSCDRAVTHVVSVMLNNDKILSYLKEQE